MKDLSTSATPAIDLGSQEITEISRKQRIEGNGGDGQYEAVQGIVAEELSSLVGVPEAEGRIDAPRYFNLSLH